MIEKIFIISFIVFAIHYTMQEGEIFGKLGAWFERKLPQQLHPTVFDCVVCMAPWYGSVVYWLVFAPMRIESLWPVRIIVPVGTFIEWVVVVMGAMGLNAILNKAFPDEEESISELARKYNVPGGVFDNVENGQKEKEPVHMLIADAFVMHLEEKKKWLYNTAEELIQERDNPENAERCYAKAELIDEIIKEINA